MIDESKYAVVTTTVSNSSEADELALKIVEAKLAACVQQTPIKSTYRWECKIEHAHEILLTAKTKSVLADELVDFIKANHSYDVPEVIVTPVISGNTDYLKWISDESK